MKKYSIHYLNSGVKQEKALIPHNDYLRVKRIIDNEEYEMSYKKLAGGNPWFTDKSPLYSAISTGVLVIGEYKYPCEVIEIINP